MVDAVAVTRPVVSLVVPLANVLVVAVAVVMVVTLRTQWPWT